MLEGIPTGTVFQGATLFTVIAAALTALGIWIRHGPERGRVRNESLTVQAKIEEDLRSDAAQRFAEFRKEVHGLRNELAKHIADLTLSEASRRRGSDKLSMMGFILQLVMTELRRLDPDSPTLDQAERLLESLLAEDAPEIDKSKALKKAERTVTSAQDTVDEVKHSEAVDNGNGDGDDK